MKLTVLGTAAAEAQPAFFCECDTCRYAREHGGKDVRKRCAYLLDDDTFIDYGPDINAQVMMYGIDWTKIDRIIFTHAHSDHLDPIELIWRNNGFSKVTKNIDVYGDTAVHEKIKNVLNYENSKLIENQVRPGDIFKAGDMEVLALRADHDPNSTPLNYVITRNGKSLLIANDTGFWNDENWALIKNYGKKLDFAVIECTTAFLRDQSQGHMSNKYTVLFRDKLIEIGVADKNTRFITNHFSHNGAPLQKDLEAFFVPQGIEVAYDGMVIEF
jgi:phosphoribosyl 1,2-cyclic phosphate phosphodiesterase